MENQHIVAVVEIRIRPTVPHCHLTQQIGLAIRMKLGEELPL
jgi:metal-sulfur cluster biosynthetic enzyme